MKTGSQSELKNVEITQIFELQNGSFFAQRLLYVCILQF